jgi:hypothetical protein
MDPVGGWDDDHGGTARRSMTVRLDDNHFSPKSSASRVLAQALKRVNNDGVARATTRFFAIYIDGLGEIIKMDNPARDEVFNLWHEFHLNKARQKLMPSFAKFDLPFSEYENLLIFRLRSARTMGTIMQKMRS